MQDSLYLYFDDLVQPVRLTGCADLIDDFPVLFPHRDYREGKQDDSPIISIQFDGGEYHISSSRAGKTATYIDKVDVFCDLIARLAVARSYTDLEALYLHAAAVEINGRAVVFPSQYRAGKSFLTACFLAEGHHYVGDDIVPMELGSAKVHTPGFSPRLRLPLPETTDKKSRDFIECHTAVIGERYGYLNIEPELRMTRNESLDIGAFVLLKREKGIKAQLESLPVATVFQQLIKQNFAREVDSSLILSTLTQAVSNAQCFKLHYDRADEAVRLLKDQFACWPSRTHISQVEQNSPDPVIHTEEREESGDYSNKYFNRNLLVQKIRIEDESFLTSPDGKAIYHLNQIGAGIWELLSKPTTKEFIVSTLETAFPETETSTIDRDVTIILNRFQLKKLISC